MQTLIPRVTRSLFPLITTALFLVSVVNSFAADDKPKPQPDVVIFTNGDQLSGKFVRAVGDTVTFHSDVVGDVNVGWDKIKELHTGENLAVLEKGVQIKDRHVPPNFPMGRASMADQQIMVRSTTATLPAIPVRNARVVVDEGTFNKQLIGRPGFFQGWNGGATAGATITSATQNSYAFTGAVNLLRVVPTVDWLDPSNRTTVNYLQAYGKITQPSYIDASGNFIPSSYTKTSILHADAERDEYFTRRLYVLGLVAFDHNFSQSLDLQQIYGGGLGWTAIRDAKQELDLKGTVQYQRQQFFNVVPPAAAELNLISSTFGANYNRKLPRGMVFNQQVSYTPAWNDLHAYTIAEANSLVFPTYKNLSFTVGTLNSYLNNPPLTIPPTKRNSFTFTMGVTYAIKSSY
ncbi:MAG TPA: DUF481 domain-containing protein [Pseudacidobacterium sp.]|jgi:hypothetical protein|nr:DUF481 domain-containing protein [Pseudacidobacterium sp.]